MSWVDGLRHRVRVVLRPRAYEAELDEEMSHHLALDAQQQSGAGARRRFGNRVYYREEARRMTWLGTLDVLRQDVAHSWRSLARSPGVTAVIVVTLALGIGVNAAAFTLLDRLYIRPPGGVAEPSTLRRVWIEHFNTADGMPFISQPINYPIFRAIAESAEDPKQVAVYMTVALRLGRSPSAPTVRGVYATANYFDVLGVRAALGRVYGEDEDRLGAGAPVVVLSHAFWQRHFGGDSAVLGRTLQLGSNRYTVIGVFDRSFHGLDLQPSEVWLPLGSMSTSSWRGSSWWESYEMFALRAVVRERHGAVSGAFEQRATARVYAVNRALRPSRPDTSMKVYTGSIVEARGPDEPGAEVLISTRLSGVAVVVLLIACANVINLLLARAVRRRREMAVRLALGISRWRLVRLLTTETMLLALIAGGTALLVGSWGGSLLRALVLPDIEWADSTLDARVALFTIAVALAAGLIAGIVPGLQSSDADLTSALKVGAREGVRHRSRLRSGLVVAQAALSVMLLIGATLFVRSLRNVQGLDIGYDAGRLLFGNVAFAEGEALPQPVVGAMMRDVASRLERHPGVEAVARVGMQPMRGFSFVDFYVGADSLGSFIRGGMPPTMSAVSPGFFRAAGMRLLRGRGFSGGDAEVAPPEVIVSEAMAKLVWPDAEALGQCMRFESREGGCYQVVGVVENVRRTSVIEEEPAAQYYLPLANMPVSGWAGTTLVVRARPQATSAAAAELRTALQRAFPSAAATVTPMLENLEPEYRPWRLGATLFTAFGVLALLVALVGIYTTVSYGVSQRTHEFGVRLALGARVGDLLRQVVGEGLRIVAIGVGLGVLLALAAGRLVAALLYGIEPSDPGALLLVSAFLLSVAAIAALVPAWRAARVDPLSALRTE